MPNKFKNQCRVGNVFLLPAPLILKKRLLGFVFVVSPIYSVSRSHDVHLGLKNSKSIWFEKRKINLQRQSNLYFIQSGNAIKG